MVGATTASSQGGDEKAGLLASASASANNSAGGYNSVEQNEVMSDVGSGSSSIASSAEHGTTAWEAFFNLLKGYFGAGMLR